MAKFRKKPMKPEEVEATQWFRNGDHPQDKCNVVAIDQTANRYWSEGQVVGRFRENDEGCHGAYCTFCGGELRLHGTLASQGGRGIVCPGDWIITKANGERIVYCKDAFERDYEPVED